MSTTETDIESLHETSIDIQGMNCASCVAHVEKAARNVPGVQDCQVNLARGNAQVKFNSEQTNPNLIASAITATGYTAKIEAATTPPAQVEDERLQRQQKHAHAWFMRAIAGLILWFPVELIHWIRHLTMPSMQMGIDWMVWLSFITSTVAILYVGYAFYRSAFKALLRGTSNMDTLIAMGASVAYLYSLIALIGALANAWPLPDLYFMESTGLLALISLGHYLEARARQSAGSAIRQLLNLTPATATRIVPDSQKASIFSPSPGTPGEGRGEGSAQSSSPADDNHETIPVADLHINDTILVRPGDRIPIDGVILDGQSSIDESMITGESLPISRTTNDPVIGGTQNIDGALRVRVSKIGSETALAQIVKLVEHAQSTKPAVQKLADRIAAIFVPSVLTIALITAVGWYLWGTAHHWDSPHTWAILAKSVCSVLIIACPCALGLAVPAALMVGTGMGAQRGILIRDIDALQTAEKIDTVVLDKTGTITQGKPVVSEIQPLAGLALEEVLRLAASTEQYSEHPLAKAIVSHARERGIPLLDPESFTNEPGAGVTATISGKTIRVGNATFVSSDTGVPPVPNDSTTTQVYVSANGEPIAILHISDQIKSDSIQAINQLHRMNLRTILLSGDNEHAARAIANQVGITDVRANVKPAGKADAIRKLQRQAAIDDQLASEATLTSRRNPKVAMVGDGINDAPALAQADLGIAIGSGSDIAKETGDIVLVGGSLRGIAVAIRLSRATMRTIRQNLFLAFIYNVLAIPLAAFGLLNPLIAAAAMALSDVTVIGNALLLRRARIEEKHP